MSGKRYFACFFALASGLTVLRFTMPVTNGQYRLVDLKALGNFNFDQVLGVDGDVPANNRRLDGQRVQITGFMWSPSSAAALNTFQFVYNIHQQHPGLPPLIQERIFANLPAGKTAPYLDSFVCLQGTLHVDVKHQDGIVTSVYEMDVESMTRGAKRIYPPPIKLTPGGSVTLEPPFEIKDDLTLAMYGAWMVTAIFFVGCVIRTVWKWRAVAAGRCLHCGYDLRASTDRCPECGSSEALGRPSS